MADCCIAAAEGRDAEVLRHGLYAMSYRDSLGIGADPMRVCWPTATRAALQLGDLGAADEMLAVLDGVLPGRLPPVLRAERELVRARLAVARHDAAGADGLRTAIEVMRQLSPPHLLAHALLDHASYLRSQGDDAATAVSMAEARDIGERLGCRPLLARADTLSPVSGTVPSPR
jgi:hypothetical protein